MEAPALKLHLTLPYADLELPQPDKSQDQIPGSKFLPWQEEFF